VVPLRELAHHEYHARGSQEEPRVHRTSVGNAGYEPRQRQAIQEEVAQTEQSHASSRNECQLLEEPDAVPEHPALVPLR
jgi:hypothetical protein